MKKENWLKKNRNIKGIFKDEEMDISNDPFDIEWVYNKSDPCKHTRDCHRCCRFHPNYRNKNGCGSVTTNKGRMMDSILTFFGENILWILLIPALILFIASVKKFFPNVYKDDNAIEECVEGVIKEKTGIDQDLTPSSPETPKEEAPK